MLNIDLSLKDTKHISLIIITKKIMTHELIEKSVSKKEILPAILEKSKEIISYSNIFGDFALEINEEVAKNSLKNIFGKSVELAENTLDSIISTYYQQMEVTVDFNTNLENAVRELNPDNAEKLLTLIKYYFEMSWEKTTENTKNIMEHYSEHANMANKINKKFDEIIESQDKNIFHLQNKGLDHFNEWSSEWWKQPTAEKE